MPNEKGDDAQAISKLSISDGVTGLKEENLMPRHGGRRVVTGGLHPHFHLAILLRTQIPDAENFPCRCQKFPVPRAKIPCDARKNSLLRGGK